MKKPKGYDECEAFIGGNGGAKLEPGGYICRIRGAMEETSQNGYLMLVVAFDIAEGENAGFYDAIHREKIKSNLTAKWPGLYRQGIENKDGTCSQYFKGMISAIEKSNPGYEFDWNEKTLTGKLFGGVFGEEEWIDQQGQVRTTTKLRWIRSVQAIRDGDFEVPAVKKLPKTGDTYARKSGFTDYKDDEPLPWEQ